MKQFHDMLHKFLHSKLGKVDFSRLLQKIDKYADFNNNGQVKKIFMNDIFKVFATGTLLLHSNKMTVFCEIYLKYEGLLGNIAFTISEELYESF